MPARVSSWNDPTVDGPQPHRLGVSSATVVWAKIKEVLARTYSGSNDSRPLPEEKIPQGLDWGRLVESGRLFGAFNNQWLIWEQWYDFCGGWMTNWGAHGIDMIQAALGMDESGPVETRPLTPASINGQSAKCAMPMACLYVLSWGPTTKSTTARTAGGIFV